MACTLCLVPSLSFWEREDGLFAQICSNFIWNYCSWSISFVTFVLFFPHTFLPLHLWLFFSIVSTHENKIQKMHFPMIILIVKRLKLPIKPVCATLNICLDIEYPVAREKIDYSFALQYLTSLAKRSKTTSFLSTPPAATLINDLGIIVQCMYLPSASYWNPPSNAWLMAGQRA